MLFKDTASNLKHIIGADGHSFWLSSLLVWHDVLWITAENTRHKLRLQLQYQLVELS